MNPSIPYSLANYWWESGWGNFDLSSQMFPVITMNDPRAAVVVAPTDTGGQINAKLRGALVNGAIAQATSNFGVVWDNIDIVMIWYAQQTDMFGGGQYVVPLSNGGAKSVTATVVDLGSTFDSVCQELGHGYGLDHEIDAGGNHYASPYSSMSSRLYGRTSPDFLRPPDSRLPDGILLTDPNDRFARFPAGRVTGPALTPAQLYKYPWFEMSPRVVTVPASFLSRPARIRLYALDYARERSQSAVLPVLAVIRPTPKTGYWFTIELRRGGQRFDAGIGGTNSVPAGLVVHALTPEVNYKIRYEGVLPLAPTDGDSDWTSVAKLFTLRLVELGPGNEWADFTVTGGPTYARDVNLDSMTVQSTDHPSPWEQVVIWGGCMAGDYSYRMVKSDWTWTIFANSYGFEAPSYRWTINGIVLSEGATDAPLVLAVEAGVPNPPVGENASKVSVAAAEVSLRYSLAGNKLEMRLADAPGNFTMTVGTVATGTPSDGIEVASERYLNPKSVRYEWDSEYKRQLAECFDWTLDMVNQELPPLRIDPGDPPDFGIRPDEIEAVLVAEHVIQSMRAEQPERAEEMMGYLRQRFNLSEEVMDARRHR